MIIDKKNTVCVSGHRSLERNFSYQKLYAKLNELADKYSTFLVGMAVGYDTLCFKLLHIIREVKDIKIIACIPCKCQDAKFSLEQKKEYGQLLELADEKIYISDEYTPYCMMQRNKFMVDNSSYLLAYLRRNSGGTFNTVSYAKKQGITVEII